MRIYLFYLFLIFSVEINAQDSAKPVLQSALESNYDDISPVMAPEGDILYFTKRKHPQNVGGEKDEGDIWFSRKVNNEWMAPEPLTGSINNEAFNSVIGITPDGNIMYVTGNYQQPKKAGISYLRKGINGWKKPKFINIPYFKNISDHLSGSLSADGEIMVISLQSYNTQGNEDIYYTFRKSVDEWTELRNLGPDINTKAQEFTPYLAKDNTTLFFSSNGRGGQGSRDIFVSKRQGATWANWSTPENVTVLNSEGADWYYRLTADGEQAYMVNTVNSLNLGNIFLTRLPELIVLDTLDKQEPVVESKPVVPYNDNDDIAKKTKDRPKLNLKFIVKDAQTGDVLSPQLIIKAMNENSKRSFSEIILGEGSGYQTNLWKDSVYNMAIDIPGYLEAQKFIKTDTLVSDDTVVFELIKLEKGTTVQLKNVLFKRGTAEMLEVSFDELNSIVNTLKRNDDIEIALTGHTDNTGSPKLNIELSQKRADTVKEYLIAQGISAKRLESKGYGGARPIASNKSEDTRRLNRRVEFTIIKN